MIINNIQQLYKKATFHKNDVKCLGINIYATNKLRHCKNYD